MNAFLIVFSLIFSFQNVFADCSIFESETSLKDPIITITPYDQPELVTVRELLATRPQPEIFETSPLYENLKPEVLHGDLPTEFARSFGWEVHLEQKGADRFKVDKISTGIPLDPKLKDILKIVSSNHIAAQTAKIGKPGHQSLEIHMIISGRKLRSLMREVDYPHLERNQMTSAELKSHGLDYLRHQSNGQDALRLFIANKNYKTRPFSLAAPEAGLFSHNDFPLGTIRIGAQVNEFEPNDLRSYKVILQAERDFVPIFRNGQFDHFIENNHDTNRYLLMKFYLEKVKPLLH